MVGSDDMPSVILASKSDAEACFTNGHRFFRYFFLVHSGCKYVRVLVAYRLPGEIFCLNIVQCFVDLTCRLLNDVFQLNFLCVAL